MAAIEQIRLCGFGGQGIILAGAILGHAVVKDGKWVAQTSSYGAAARGGSCRADVVISDEPIIFPHLIEADVLVAMFQSAYDHFIKDTKDSGLVIYDDQLVSPGSVDGLKHISIPATATAVEELNGRHVANIVILGAVAEITKIVGKDALISAVEEDVPERFKSLNLKAVDIGFKLGRGVGTTYQKE